MGNFKYAETSIGGAGGEGVCGRGSQNKKLAYEKAQGEGLTLMIHILHLDLVEAAKLLQRVVQLLAQVGVRVRIPSQEVELEPLRGAAAVLLLVHAAQADERCVVVCMQHSPGG